MKVFKKFTSLLVLLLIASVLLNPVDVGATS